MNPDNDWYGHKRVLTDYCGVKRKRAIFGYIPHGWAPDWTVEQGQRRFTSAPLLVWNKRHQEQAISLGIKNVVCIGAPFIYAVDGFLGRERSPGRGTIIFPTHTAEGTKYEGEFESFVNEVHEKCPPPYTVSIYYQDRNTPNEELFRKHGWRVVSFGARSDDLFLYRQISELVRHEHVVGNLLQTALWYGAYLGKTIQILGPVPKLLHVSALHDEAKIDAELNRRLNYEKMFPGLRSTGLSIETSFEAASSELGADYFLSPKNLNELLGWASPVKGISALLMKTLSDFRYGIKIRNGKL